AAAGGALPLRFGGKTATGGLPAVVRGLLPVDVADRVVGELPAGIEAERHRRKQWQQRRQVARRRRHALAGLLDVALVLGDGRLRAPQPEALRQLFLPTRALILPAGAVAWNAALLETARGNPYILPAIRRAHSNLARLRSGSACQLFQPEAGELGERARR